MTHANDPTQTPAVEPRTGGFCSWHRLYSRTAVPVRAVVDEDSGPASSVLYACLPCRRAYDLIPLSEQPR